MTVTVLWHRWFVQYNPFYLASALFVLGGIYLLTRNPADWESEQLVLAGVIQLYELALIAAAAFLFDLPSQRRPAVILGWRRSGRIRCLPPPPGLRCSASSFPLLRAPCAYAAGGRPP
ncbi:MAG: hypothetical protein ACT4P4_17970 [Betaproteobacteria bacterium]